MRITIAAALAAFTASAAFAIPTRIDITRLPAAASIRIDGDLSDAGWRNAANVRQFFEYFRGDNNAPPVKTEGFLTYDAQYVYVAFRADDPRPDLIRAPLVDRDMVRNDQDFVAIAIDAQNDRRSAIQFRVNPRGVQTDSVYIDSTGTEDFSPDFFFESVARETENGWQAEMRIPLSSLRYPSRDPQTWGVILTRNYPRDFRYAMSNTPIPRNSNCFVCHASELTGLHDLPDGAHMTVTPYTTASRRDARGGEEAGLDLKWSPSARTTFDATVNPDFSQVEADAPQLAANNRFALEYPEKRAFFLEGVDLLATPLPAVQTRSITAPAWGARVTGNRGDDAYTLLVAEDRGGGSIILPGTYGSESTPQDFASRVAIGRFRRSYGNSFAGLLVTTRDGDGGHNRVFGPDLQWKPNANDRVLAEVLVSDTKNPERPDLAAQFDGSSQRGGAARFLYTRDAASYDIWFNTLAVSPGFRADDGFVPQAGYRHLYTEVGRRVYPKSGFSYIRPYFGVFYDTEYARPTPIHTAIFPGVYFQGKWGSEGWITLRAADRERVNGQQLDYHFVEFWTRLNPAGWLPSLELSGERGGKLDYAGARRGRGSKLGVVATLRPSVHLELAGELHRESLQLRDRQHLFDATAGRVKATYAFTAKSLVRVIAAQNETNRNAALYTGNVDARDRSRSLSALYGYRVNVQTLVYAGYGDASDNPALPSRRSVFVKLAYAVQR